MPRPARSAKRHTAVKRAAPGASPRAVRLCRKRTSDTPIRNWKTGAGKSKARSTSPSLCCRTSGTRRRKTFIMLANSMPSTASARQTSTKASRGAAPSPAISVHLGDAVEQARLDPPVELVRPTEAAEQVAQHRELAPVLAERPLLGGQLGGRTRGGGRWRPPRRDAAPTEEGSAGAREGGGEARQQGVGEPAEGGGSERERGGGGGRAGGWAAPRAGWVSPQECALPVRSC